MRTVDLQAELGVTPDGMFGPASRNALFAALSNRKAPGLTIEDYMRAAVRLGAPIGHIRGVRKIEAPRGPYDDLGRPSILYERHVFRRSTQPPRQFDAQFPLLSGPAYGPGGYGAFSAQYDKLGRACALDANAALMACSWGAFQVLGENATALGYASAWDMAKSLVVSEAAHLETFVRYVEVNGLKDEFQAMRPHDPISCVPFVSKYNGPGHAAFNYAPHLAEAIA